MFPNLIKDLHLLEGMCSYEMVTLVSIVQKGIEQMTFLWIMFFQDVTVASLSGKNKELPLFSCISLIHGQLEDSIIS